MLKYSKRFTKEGKFRTILVVREKVEEAQDIFLGKSKKPP